MSPQRISYRILACVLLLVLGWGIPARGQSFDLQSPPAGWTVESGTAATVEGVRSDGGTKPLLLRSQPVQLPLEWTVRLSVPEKAAADLQVFAAEDGKTPALQAGFLQQSAGRYMIRGHAAGEPLPMLTPSSRLYTRQFQNQGFVWYHWRFPAVANLWDQRDRAEIGASYARLTPLGEKLLVARLVVTEEGGQIWIDDRLAAEHRGPIPGPVTLGISVRNGASVISSSAAALSPTPGFEVLKLDDYESDGRSRPMGPKVNLTIQGRSVPMQLIGSATPEIDLGNSLERYRLTFKSGPNAPYVNGRHAWPDPLKIDPALAAFRVPYRAYQNAYLVVWVDDDPLAVPAGTLRFYRDMAGYAAATDFEVTPQALKRGDVRKLDQTTHDGKSLYLIRVPIDTDAFAGFADLRGHFLDLQITKPVALSRSYPDPIYYGRHPAGRDSSLHVVGVTLEEAAFDYRAEPIEYGHLFEQPQTPAYDVEVDNPGDRRLVAQVRLQTTSYDGSERTVAREQLKIEPGQTGRARIELDDITQLGWHEVKVRVEAAGQVRQHTISLVVLPPNTRTYGYSANETRFGAWTLLGHYTPFTLDKERNDKVLAALRKIGVRSISLHQAFFTPEMLKRHDMVPDGPHTIVSVFHRLDENDPEQVSKMLADELAQVETVRQSFGRADYYYGGEWGYDHAFTHAVNPRYTGKGPWPLDEAAIKNLNRQQKIFTSIGRMLREKAPGTNLILQWGGPQNTIGFLENDFPKDLVDAFGMDMPMFELMPETPVAVGTINYLWTLRQEAARTGWPRLPIYWCEGPFLPTNEGALSLEEQEQHQIRYWLLGMAYGVEKFHAGIVAHDSGGYYGAEHYGAGVFHRVPLENPKPAVAAIATATRMLCGADVVGPVDTGVLTTYAMAFRHADRGEDIYALWRVRGQVQATMRVESGTVATVTNAMGNSYEAPVVDGQLTLTLTPSPIWVTGVSGLSGFTFDEPRYEAAPAQFTAKLPEFTPDAWQYDPSEQPSYAKNHLGVDRQTDDQLTVNFSMADEGFGSAVAVVLPTQPAGDRTLTARYGSLVLREPAVIPGKARSLGLWIKGNGGWGRVVYQLRDAEGEVWTSIGTKEDWNCDDTFTRSFVNFEGWRWVSFPLPANQPWDLARELEFTWWKHEGGDGIVDLPLTLERVMVEARNEVHYLGQMKLVPNRSYQLAGLVAEYERDVDASDAVLALYRLRKPLPQWAGPETNPIAQMTRENQGPAPTIIGFEEPHHWNDGRRMIIRFEAKPDHQYELYLSRYADGRGAEKLGRTWTDKQLVTGLRPDIEMFLFLVEIDPQGKASRPSAAYRLVTRDKFAEK